jgi:hypothetical protein
MKAEEKTGVLRHKDFIFIPSDCCRERFDLYRATKTKKTGKDSKKLIGYGYRFDEACTTMLELLLSERSDIGDLKTYVSEYRKAVKELKVVLA